MDREQNIKQKLEFNYVVGRPKTSFSARFYAYFQILRSLPDSAKNFAGAESQNPRGTDICMYHIRPHLPFLPIYSSLHFLQQPTLV